MKPAERMGWEEVAADATVVIGRCREGTGDRDEVEARFLSAIERAERVGLPRVAWEAHAAMSTLARSDGKKAEADHHAGKARAIARRLARTIADEDLRRTFVRRGSATAAPR